MFWFFWLYKANMLKILIIIKTINIPIFDTVEIIWYNTRNNVSYHCYIWIMIHKSQIGRYKGIRRICYRFWWISSLYRYVKHVKIVKVFCFDCFEKNTTTKRYRFHNYLYLLTFTTCFQAFLRSVEGGYLIRCPATLIIEFPVTSSC